MIILIKNNEKKRNATIFVITWTVSITDKQNLCHQHKTGSIFFRLAWFKCH
jgi:hypothetical protein